MSWITDSAPVRPERLRRLVPPVPAIVVGYVVVAVLWIATSDHLAALLIADRAELTAVETLKGAGFVAVTGILLAVMLHRHDAFRNAQLAELEERERRYRLLAEHAQDVIFRWVFDPTPRLEYLSPAAEHLLGYPSAAFLDDPGLLLRLVHPDDRALFEIDATSRSARTLVLRFRHADGHWVWVEQRSSLVLGAAGEPAALEGVARDITAQRRAETALARVNRVLRTLSAANQALLRAESEPALLQSICQTVVQGGGFRFAWVGYCESDAAGTIRPVAQAGHEAGYLDVISVTWHDEAHGRGPAGTAARDGRTAIVRDLATDPSMEPWRTEALARGYAGTAALALRGDEGVFGVLVIYAAEAGAFDTQEVALLEELAGDLAFGVNALRTRSAAARAEAERRRLAAAIEQSAESVVIADAAGRIEYVNPAFERVTGYSKEEAVGQNPRILKSGVQGDAFYRAMWRTLTDGRTWIGDFVNRRKDGALFTEEAVITPVHGPEGATKGYVAVKRDVTRERDAHRRERVRVQERTAVAHALAALPFRASPQETAEAACRQMARLPEAAAAALIVFDPDGRADPIGVATADGQAIHVERLHDQRSRYLRRRAEEGAWVETWHGTSDHPLSAAFRSLGIRALACAPLHVGGEAVGLLEVAAALPDAADRLAERIPALVEFASIASASLGPSLSSRAELGRRRARIQTIIDQRAFRPVFQPIVNLATRTILGYEALTRFADGTPPDAQFQEASAVGLGVELETAALGLALETAGALPPVAWLNVNASPETVFAAGRLSAILDRHPGDVVLEVTEHEAITDYPAFRAAVARLGPRVSVAVDDAGAGFSSLRHIVELRPRMVKVDRSLVAGIDGDPARQALLAGLRHFADAQGCDLVAEGIETDGELAALVALDVHLGQGYLLGIPAPVPPPLTAR